MPGHRVDGLSHRSLIGLDVTNFGPDEPRPSRRLSFLRTLAFHDAEFSTEGMRLQALPSRNNSAILSWIKATKDRPNDCYGNAEEPE